MPTNRSHVHPGDSGSLREAHAHIASLGESLEMPTLAGCRSVGECLEAVAAAVRDAVATGRPFVRLTSARVEAWAERRWPTLAEIDAVAGGVPCVIMSFDHHSAAAGTAALRAAGLAPGARVGAQGVVIADERTGGPTGVLLEDAAYAAWNAAPEPTREDRRRHVRAALAHLAGLGFVEVHDLHSQAFLGPVLAELERSGELELDAWLYPPLDRIEADVVVAKQWGSDRVRLAGAKLFADGTLNSRTAHMMHRYAEPLPGKPRGQCMVAPEALDEAVARVDRLGLPLAVHAIGDAAVRTVLDSIQRVRGSRAEPGRSDGGIGRFRIEHAELIDARDVPRFAAMGVVCSVQPCHLLYDIEALRRFVPHRLDRVLPLRELIDSGCRPGPDGLLWFGSDVPIVPADPRDSVQAAVKRRRAAAGEDEAIAPGQAISEAEAWAGFQRAR